MLKRTFVALLLVALCGTAAHGYVVLKHWDGDEKTWAGSNVTWYLSSSLMSDVTEDGLVNALQAAFDAWEDVSCATINFSYGGKTGWDPGDGIFVRFQEYNWDPSVGDALAYSVSNNGSTISSNEVVFNAYDAEWSVAGTTPMGKVDVQGVATHEIGHSIGLDHSRHIEATMFFSGGSTELRTLDEDDEHGACYLYPSGSFNDGQACDSCQDSSHCADGVCLDWGGGETYCGQDCTSSAGCPEGFSCVQIDTSIPNQCVPNNEYCHQYGSNVPLGEFCYGSEVCSSGLCLVMPGDAICSKECGTCPSGFTCSQGFCLEAGSKAYGALCEDHSDCQSATCIWFASASGVCTQLCGEYGGACPNNNQCFQNAACVPPGPGANGTQCLFQSDCQGTYCIGGKCTQACNAGYPCPEGTNCVDGFCAGTEIGGTCQSTQDCPAGQFCHDLDGPKSCGVECNSLNGLGCFEGEGCVWYWEAATESIRGVCKDLIGGRGLMETCGSAACEVDLICHVGIGSTERCHKDCKLNANNLGCSTGEKCISLEDPSDPKHGVCVDKNPPPPDEGPPPDTGGEPDAGGQPDTPSPPDEGPPAPDDAGPGADDLPSPPADGGTPFVDGAVGPTPDGGTIPFGDYTNGGGGGGPTCTAGAGPGGPLAALLVVAALAWLSAARRRRRPSA